jgi:hypothetical protein
LQKISCFTPAEVLLTGFMYTVNNIPVPAQKDILECIVQCTVYCISLFKYVALEFDFYRLLSFKRV